KSRLSPALAHTSGASKTASILSTSPPTPRSPGRTSPGSTWSTATNSPTQIGSPSFPSRCVTSPATRLLRLLHSGHLIQRVGLRGHIRRTFHAVLDAAHRMGRGQDEPELLEAVLPRRGDA